jgi:hypothetical protein
MLLEDDSGEGGRPIRIEDLEGSRREERQVRALPIL